MKRSVIIAGILLLLPHSMRADDCTTTAKDCWMEQLRHDASSSLPTFSSVSDATPSLNNNLADFIAQFLNANHSEKDGAVTFAWNLSFSPVSKDATKKPLSLQITFNQPTVDSKLSDQLSGDSAGLDRLKKQLGQTDDVTYAASITYPPPEVDTGDGTSELFRRALSGSASRRGFA
ncbi:MAG TPA: hypothetical protein VGJ88_09015, partial [Thermoanaerobaculia bacterium]